MKKVSYQAFSWQANQLIPNIPVLQGLLRVNRKAGKDAQCWQTENNELQRKLSNKGNQKSSKLRTSGSMILMFSWNDQPILLLYPLLTPPQWVSIFKNDKNSHMNYSWYIYMIAVQGVNPDCQLSAAHCPLPSLNYFYLVIASIILWWKAPMQYSWSHTDILENIFSCSHQLMGCLLSVCLPPCSVCSWMKTCVCVVDLFWRGSHRGGKLIWLWKRCLWATTRHKNIRDE